MIRMIFRMVTMTTDTSSKILMKTINTTRQRKETKIKWWVVAINSTDSSKSMSNKRTRVETCKFEDTKKTPTTKEEWARIWPWDQTMIQISSVSESLLSIRQQPHLPKIGWKRLFERASRIHFEVSKY